MARVTVEDCVERVPNRFDLVMIAAQRAREIAAGGSLTVERDDDKNPVVALREVAEDTVDRDALQENLIKGHQKMGALEEPEQDIMDLMSAEEAWQGVSQEGAGDDATADQGDPAAVPGAFRYEDIEEDER